MTKTDCRKRIKEAIKELNKMDHKLTFRFNEEEWGLELEAHGSDSRADCRFGAFEPRVFFEDYKDKSTAYDSFMSSLSLMIASAKLCDPKAYHNFVA